MGQSFVNTPEHEEGGQRKVVTDDITQEELLGEVLKQLKIMNMHLSLITDNQISKEEI